MKAPSLLFVVLAVCATCLAQTPPPNDLCANAIPVFDGVNPGAPSGTNGSVFSNIGGGVEGTSACTSSFGSGSDVWFLYTATATGTATVTTCPPAGFVIGSLQNLIVSVYASCSGIELGCFIDGQNCSIGPLGVAVTAGASYIIRVADLYGALGTFYLTMGAPVPPPINDLCANAIPVFDGVNPNAPAGISGNTYTNVGAATDGTSNCAASSSQPTHHDVWFTYVATATGTARMATCTPPGFTAGPGEALLTVFASCGGAEIACNVSNYCDFGKAQLGVNVTAGASYLIRVASQIYQPGTFYLTIAPPGPPPANDTCANAIPVFDGINPAAPGASFTNLDATPDVTSCTLGEPDVWFAYTAMTSGVTTITSAPAGPSPVIYPKLSIFASCGAPALACDFGWTMMTIPVAAGTTYLIRASSHIAVTGPFTISITTPVPAASNDECAGAIPLPLGYNGVFMNSGASVSFPASGPAWPDLWYSFTTGACPGSYTVDLCPDTYGAFEVFATCGGPALAGAFSSFINGFPSCARTTINLTPYTTYLLRVIPGYYYGVNILQGSTLTSTFSSPGGPTCVEADLSGIPSNGLYFLAVTQNAGAFPYGALYGIDIPYSELIAEASVGYPFAGSADACGNAQLGPYCGLPSGVTLYAVAFAFSGGYSLTPTRYTTASSYTIP